MPTSIYKTVDFGPSKTGLSTVGYTLTGLSRITSGVSNIAGGIYGATVVIPDGFSGAILWDTGQGGSTVYASEDINPQDINEGVATSSQLASPLTVGTVSDKTGYKLAADGLDQLPTTLSGSMSSWKWPQWMLWGNLKLRRSRKDKTTGIISVYNADQTSVISTQATTNTEAEQTVGAPQ